jgi:hypothetical protein
MVKGVDYFEFRSGESEPTNLVTDHHVRIQCPNLATWKIEEAIRSKNVSIKEEIKKVNLSAQPLALSCFNIPHSKSIVIRS